MRGDEPVSIESEQGVEGEFPACAGMNRSSRPEPCRWHRVPRMRGDEPAAKDAAVDKAVEFPACAGMNRLARRRT